MAVVVAAVAVSTVAVSTVIVVVAAVVVIVCVVAGHWTISHSLPGAVLRRSMIGPPSMGRR